MWTKQQKEAQKKYRSRPEIRERYLQDARERSKKWYSIPGNRKRRYEYNQKAWLRHIRKLEGKAGRKRPKNCEICGEKKIICFDHCHKTGKFRGWICERCNTVLGKCKDNKFLLRKLIQYIG